MIAFLAGLPVDRFVMDGEVVVEIDGMPSFDALQATSSSRKQNSQAVRRDTGAACGVRYAYGTTTAYRPSIRIWPIAGLGGRTRRNYSCRSTSARGVPVHA